MTGFLVDSPYAGLVVSHHGPRNKGKGVGSMTSPVLFSGHLSLTHICFFLNSKYHLIGTAVKKFLLYS